MPKPLAMDIDTSQNEQERSTRAASVLSGMSVEDMEAAETLNSLQQSTPMCWCNYTPASADH